MISRWRFRPTMSLWATTIMLATTGCVSIMSEERVGDPVHSAQTLDVRPIGMPRMTLTAHDDGLGWTVTTETLVERAEEYRVVRQWRGRRYVFSPLSLFPGMIQCPMGLLHLFDANPAGNRFRFGCARLVLFEPLDGVTALPPTNGSWVETQTGWEPLQHGMIQLVLLGGRHHAVTYPVSNEGRAEVRLSDLLSSLIVAGVSMNVAQAQSIAVRLRYGDGSTVEQILGVSARQIRQASRAIPDPIASEQWPSPTIVQIRVDPTTISPHEGEFVRDQLVRSILQRRMCVVVEGLHPHLLDEQRVAYSGVVDDKAQVRLGELLSPSVILIATAGRSGEGSRSVRHLAVQIRDVREGQILGTAYGSARSEMIRQVVERTFTELELLMARAPRTGCPLR